MKFSKVPIDACFRLRGQVHRKASATTYYQHGYGAEVAIRAKSNVKPVPCAPVRPTIELGQSNPNPK